MDNENTNNDSENENQNDISITNVPKKQKRYRIFSEERRKKDQIKNKEEEPQNKRSESKKKSIEIKQDAIKEKLLQIILGIKKEKEEKLKQEKEQKEKEEKEEKLKKEKEKEEKLKQEKEREKKEKEKKEQEKKEQEEKNESHDGEQKIFYGTSINFHKSRLTKIKFRNLKGINNEKESSNSKNKTIKANDDKKSENKKELRKNNSNKNLLDSMNDNLNVNKETKKAKKIKKKVKRKKKDKNLENSCEYTESNIDKTEEESTVQEDKLSKSVQERKIRNKKYFPFDDKDPKGKDSIISTARKEIIQKLSIKPELNHIFESETPRDEKDEKEIINNNKPKLGRTNILKKYINNAIKSKIDEDYEQKDNKNDSLIKREQIINAGLVNNSTLNYNERMRREKLERDLASEINKDDLTDEPFTESEMDINIKNEKDDDNNRYLTKTRRIYQASQTLENDLSNISKKDNIKNSNISEDKINNLRDSKNYRGSIKNRIYNPKKAVLSKGNSRAKIIQSNISSNKISQPNNRTRNNNFVNTSFISSGNEKKTNFKIFNENCIKNKSTMLQTYNTNSNYNKTGSIDGSSYIGNRNNISDTKKYNIKNPKILYVKKSPTKNSLNKTYYADVNYDKKVNLNNRYYNSLTIKKEATITSINHLGIKKLGDNKIKKVLINRFNTSTYKMPSPKKNVSYQSNDTSMIDSNSNNDYANKTFYSNITNTRYNNPNNNSRLLSRDSDLNNKSFTLRKKPKIIPPQKTVMPEINLEDLVLMENKYFHITHNLGEKKEIANDCFDLFNYYYNSTIYHSLLNFFKDPNIIKLNINYTLMSLLVSYDLSFEKEQLNKIYLLLLEMFIINYGNLMLITEFVTNRINKNSDNVVWINLLVKKIIKYKESQEGEDIDSYSNFGLTIIEKIKYNTHYLMQKLHYILLNYDENNSNDLLFFLKTINANSYDKINIFFKENIIRENLGFSSQLASSLIKNNTMSKKMNQPKAPYIPFPSKKKYSLVLDLDETLIYLEKIKDENNGTIKIRPGTFSFLEKVKKYYEIIIFSEAEQNYVDLAASSIEENKKYFDYKLYRQHTTIENEEFIKDLNKIGRKLSNIIIVDNMPQNFRLQPENGIYIKPFWGKDNEDDVLFGLSKILLQMVDDGGDLRDGIKKYKKDIIMNVSLNYKDI